MKKYILELTEEELKILFDAIYRFAEDNKVFDYSYADHSKLTKVLNKLKHLKSL